MRHLACFLTKVLTVAVAALSSASDASIIPTVADVPLEIGSPLHLDCGVNGKHRHCFWETEDGRVFQVGDVHAGRHSGMMAPSNITNNQCGIVVEQGAARDAGTWTCKVFLRGKSLNSVKNVVRKEPKMCNPPFVTVGTGCFLFGPAKNWTDARAFCQSLSSQADLAVVDDCYLLQLIWNHILFNYGSITHWIGGTNIHHENIWLWVNDVPVTMGTPFWKPGEPNNYDGNEHCINIVSNIHAEGYLNDAACTYEYNFICQDMYL